MDILDLIRYRRSIAQDEAANNLINKYASNNPPQFTGQETIYDLTRGGEAGGMGGSLSGLPQTTSPMQGYVNRNNIIRDYAKDLPLDASSNIALNTHYDTVEKNALKQYRDDKLVYDNAALLEQAYPDIQEYQQSSEKAGLVPTAAGFFAKYPQYTKYSGFDKLNDNVTKEIAVPYEQSNLRNLYGGMATNARQTVQSPSEDLANSFDVLAKYPVDPSKASPLINRASEVTSDSFDKGGSVEDYALNNGPVVEKGQRFVTNRGAVTNLTNTEYNPEDAQLKREGHAIAREQLKHSKDNKEDDLLYKLRAEYDAADSLLSDLTTNLLDTAEAIKTSDGAVTEKDVVRARDNIAKAEAKKISKANDYGRRKYKVKQVPVGYNYDFNTDAFFNPTAPQGKRYWRP